MAPNLIRSSTILIVDDESTNLAAMSAILSPHFKIRVAKSGLKAIEIARRCSPDLALLDVDMPGMNGYEICRELLALPGCGELPIIFVTSMHSDEAEMLGFSAGGVDYVHKPVRPLLLLKRIQTHLSLRTALREARDHEADAHRLLDVLMPPVVAQELRETDTVHPRVREGVAVLFADLVGFTRWCHHRSAVEVVDGLQEVMTSLEDIAARHGVEKLKTIGDAFMAAAGLMEDDPDALRRAIRCGQEMSKAVEGMGDWSLRVGVHCGSVVAGIIGRQRFRFDVWGDTVNLASRLCDKAHSGHVCVVADALQNIGEFEVGSDVSEVDVRGVGTVLIHQISMHTPLP